MKCTKFYYLLVRFESIVMFTNYMNDELFRRLVQTPGQPCQLINLYRPLDLYNKQTLIKNSPILTFLFEVVYIVLCDDQGTILRPIVFVELHNLAAHHNYFEGC
jgi:hypothetical protein